MRSANYSVAMGQNLKSIFLEHLSQGEFRSLGPVTRGGAEIALATFFTDKPPFAGLSGAVPGATV